MQYLSEEWCCGSDVLMLRNLQWLLPCKAAVLAIRADGIPEPYVTKMYEDFQGGSHQKRKNLYESFSLFTTLCCQKLADCIVCLYSTL